jgi:O-antigen/teichoic acid export membrane protein
VDLAEAVGPQRSLRRLTLHTFANLAFGLGLQVAAGVAVARLLGPAAKGQIAYAGYIVALAVTAGEGVRSAIAYFIGARALPRPSVWAAALRLVAGIALCGTALALAFATVDGVHALAYLAAAIVIPFALYQQVVNVVYQLSHRVERINLINTATIGGGASLAILIAVVFFHAGVPIVLGLWAASYLIGTLWSRSGVRSMLGSAARFDRPELLRGAAVFGLKASLGAAVSFLALRVDVFIVATLLAPALLGIYTLALSSGELIWLASRSLTWSSTGTIATVQSERAAAELTAKVVRGTLYAGAAVALPLFLFGPWAITAVYGERFAASGAILRVVLPGLVLYGADGVLSFYLSARSGKPGTLLVLETISLALCAALTLAGVLRFGAVGAAAANTLTYTLAIALKAAFFTRESGLSPLTLLLPRSGDLPAFGRPAAGATSTTSAS